jgi:hypothetical protein
MTWNLWLLCGSRKKQQNIALQNIKRLVFTTELETVYCAVHTESLYNTHTFFFKRLELNHLFFFKFRDLVTFSLMIFHSLACLFTVYLFSLNKFLFDYFTLMDCCRIVCFVWQIYQISKVILGSPRSVRLQDGYE